MGQLRGRGYTERAQLILGAALNVGGQTSFSKEFPMGEGWRGIYLRFNNVFTVGTGTTPVTEGELLVLKNILLRTDRGEILCNLPGRALYKIATYRYGTPPRKDAIAAANGTYRVTLPIELADEWLDVPEDTVLDTKRYNSVFLQITLGTVSDLLTTPGTSSMVYTMDCEVERSFGRLPKEAEPLFHVSYDFRPPIDASNLQNIDIERSPDMSHKRIYIHTGTSGAGGTPFSGANADTIIDYITIKDQSRYIEKERKNLMIQDINKVHKSIETAIAGLLVFDFVRDGSIASAVASGDKSVLQAVWVNQGGVGANSITTLASEMIRRLK
jgi:hypothetical protein